MILAGIHEDFWSYLTNHPSKDSDRALKCLSLIESESRFDSLTEWIPANVLIHAKHKEWKLVLQLLINDLLDVQGASQYCQDGHLWNFKFPKPDSNDTIDYFLDLTLSMKER